MNLVEKFSERCVLRVSVCRYILQKRFLALRPPSVLDEPPCSAELVTDGHDSIVRNGSGNIVFQLEGILNGEEEAVADLLDLRLAAILK